MQSVQEKHKNMCVKCDIRLHAERGKTCFKKYHDVNELRE